MDLGDYTARTERMLLRPYTDDDFEAFHDLHRREDVARYLPWTPRDEPAARAALARHRDPRIEQDGDGATLAAVEPGTGRLVGEFVLFLRSREHQRGEIGYVLHPDFAGRGLATEGARHLLGLAFEGLGVRRVVARIDARNAASARVLAKLGMRHEAHLVQNERFKGEWGDEDQFAILREEWRPAGLLTGRVPDPGPGYTTAMPTRIHYTVPGMSEENAVRVIDLLQMRLHAHNDLHLTLKHVHWNVVGPHFIAVHEMIDPHVEEVRAMADDTAERIATLGGEPRGTVGSIVEERKWDNYSLGRATTQEHLGALDVVYRGVIADARGSVEEVGDLDPVTEDMLIGQLEKLELFHWFVRAHLESSGGELSSGSATSEAEGARAGAATE